MNKFFMRSFVVFVILGLAGCDFMQSQGEKAIREMIAASSDLRDAFRKVKDAPSAKEVADTLDAKFVRFNESLKNSIQYKDAKVLKSTADELNKQVQDVGNELKVEIERVKNLKGLPVEFWKVVKTRTVDLADTLADMATIENPGMANSEALHAMRQLKEQYSAYGYDGIVEVEIEAVPLNLTNQILDDLRKKNPGVNFIQISALDNLSISAAPVKDYKAFLATIDFGTILYEDEAHRAIRVNADKLMAGGMPFPPVPHAMQPGILEHQEVIQSEIEDAQAQIENNADVEAALRRVKELVEENKEEQEGPDRSDPKYFEYMADQLASDNHFKQSKAVEALLDATPADVPSAETRKKIARGFKKLAESNNSFEQDKAVKGLVIWGGKYSTPILIKMLGDRKMSEQTAVIDALGELKDPKAAEALAGKLGDFFVHDAAYNALKELGQDAEDALIAVGPASDPKICISAITLLGDCGTEKSLSFLRDAQSSGNPDVRNASKVAIKKIMARKNKAKTNKT
jgi:Skp family chaperone for outer membrane proteins